MEERLRALQLYNELSGYIQDYENLEKLLTYKEIILDKTYYKALFLRFSKESKLVSLLKELKEAADNESLTNFKELSDKILLERAILENDDGGATIIIREESFREYIKSKAVKNGYIFDEYDTCVNIIGPGAYSIFKNDEELKSKAFILKYKAKGSFDSSLIKTDLFHSDGAGGQNVNKVESGVRMTYLPLDITVTCRDERSQLFNKERCLERLKNKVEEYYENEFCSYIKAEIRKEYGKKI